MELLFSLRVRYGASQTGLDELIIDAVFLANYNWHSYLLLWLRKMSYRHCAWMIERAAERFQFIITSALRTNRLFTIG